MDALFIYNISMLQNKIYQNYIIEIFKTFLTIVLIGFSLIAWTVRAVNFLDLIVNDGYPVLKYFHYSVLNFLEFYLNLYLFIFDFPYDIYLKAH